MAPDAMGDPEERERERRAEALHYVTECVGQVETILRRHGGARIRDDEAALMRTLLAHIRAELERIN